METRDPEAREAALLAALPEQVALAKRRAPAYGALFADVAPETVTSRDALAALPVTRKSDLPEAQAGDPPFGGFAAVAPGDLARIYASPGPIYDAEGRRDNYWRTARALWATGFRKGDVVHNCFAYHFTPAGMMFETGAQALGCAVVPAGVGNTELQARAIADVRPEGYVGTPDFLKTILEKGDALGLDLGALRRAHVSGGPLFPQLKDFYADRGIAVLQSYGTADLGLVAYESPAREGLIAEEFVLIEIVRPGTGTPVPDGEVGEVVVTTFSREYPLIRFATGDLSAILPGPSPCGRTAPRIKGWMGRADQTTKVKGMFVHPRQIADVLARHPGAGRARLVVEADGGQDRMTLKVEAAGGGGLAEAMAATLQSVTKLRGTVEVVTPGSLPNDGKVIEDARSYD
ncbi:MAG: AMP-binding protein [Alphaproteobacteria bacterium]|nr:AMP-binding protein [Alphaproteobacteria bacterium]